MDLFHSDSLFILVGSLIGFGGVLSTIMSCLLTNTRSGTLKLIMIPLLLLYMYNSIAFAFYISHMFSSYLPESNQVLYYIHNAIKLLLSIIVTVTAAKLWESFRLVAHCLRFSDCSESEMTVVHGLNDFIDLSCQPSLPDYSNDGCRQWFAQIPLIVLTIISFIIIRAVSQLWEDRFANDKEPIKERSASPPPPPRSVAVTSRPCGDGCTRCHQCPDCCPCCPCSSRGKWSERFKRQKYHTGREKTLSLDKVIRDSIRGN